jgi:uncharacterized membrane protein YhaH (DUF805 family)
MSGYFSAKGRICRKTYWLKYMIPIIVMSIILEFVIQALPIIGILLLPISYLHFVGSIKRFHDFDWNGWSSIWIFVPFVALIIGFVSGNQGSNRFGEDPLKNININ